MQKKIVLMILLCCMFLTSIPNTTSASTGEEKIVTDKAILFLLDASNSMNSNDKNRRAVESIAQSVYSLPSNYLVGITVYNNQVICTTGLVESDNRFQIVEELNQIRYAGYTNAGSGLEEAVNQLMETDASEKTIIILSDGEIDMKTHQETIASQEQFQEAINQSVRENICIHVIGIGEEMDPGKANIFNAAHETGGTRLQVTDENSIANNLESLLVEQFEIKKSTAALINASGNTDYLSVSLPFQNADKVRILLTSKGVMQNLISDFHGSDAKQFTGHHYAVIEIKNPGIEMINLSVQGEAGSQIKADILPEYKVTAVMEQLEQTENLLNSPEDISAVLPQVQKFIIKFYNTDNQNQQIFTENLFESISIPIIVNEEQVPAVIHNGMLIFELGVSEKASLPITFKFDYMPVNILESSHLVFDVEVNHIPEVPEVVERDWRPAIVLLTVLGVVTVAFFLSRKSKVEKNVTIIQSEKPEPLPLSSHSYTGRLSIFITKTQSGYDVPPLSYNLFRLSSKREISLQRILDGCGTKELFEGAEKILFHPGAKRSLILTNQSDCTILRNREILLKGKSYSLPINAKVDIASENEKSELTFQYRELKPSEAEVS